MTKYKGNGYKPPFPIVDELDEAMSGLTKEQRLQKWESAKPEVNDKMNFEWHKLTRPKVTKCCGSYNWICTTEGDLCYACDKVIPDNIRVGTAEDSRNNGINISDEKFEEMYEKLGL